MRTQTVLMYHEIFSGKKPEVKSLLRAFDKEKLVILISAIGHFYYANQENANKLTIEYYNEALKFNREFKASQRLIQALGNGDRLLVSPQTIVKLQSIFFDLNDDKFSNEDSTEAQMEVLLYKCILLVNEMEHPEKLLSSIQNISFEEKYSEDKFFELLFPIHVKQRAFKHDYNLLVVPVLAFKYFEFIFKNQEAERKVNHYIRTNGFLNFHDYVITITKGVVETYTSVNQYLNDQKSKFIITFSTENPNQNIYFDSLCINLSKNKKGLPSFEFNLLNRPLYKLKEGNYLILNLTCFLKKVSIMGIRGLLKELGLENENSKAEIGHELIEKIIFRKLISHLFLKNHFQIYFDDEYKNVNCSKPDAIVVRGNDIFVFEIKDAAFSMKAVMSENAEEILAEIDKKYNSSKKGLPQLINGIAHLDQLVTLKPSKKKKRIFPVLLYTDNIFGAGGISNHLMNAFQQKLTPDVIEKYDVKDLMFLNLLDIMDRLDLVVANANNLHRIFSDTLGSKKQQDSRRVPRTEKAFPVYLNKFNNMEDLLFKKMDESNRASSKHKNALDELNAALDIDGKRIIN